MAKRPLNFSPPLTPKQAKSPSTQPLSPSHVTTTSSHAAISGVITSLSTLRANNFFEGEMTDGQSVIRLVGFDDAKRVELQSYANYGIPVTLQNCLIQQNKFKGSLEIVLKSYTKIKTSETQFQISNPKIVGSHIIDLNQLSQLSEDERVTVRVAVLKVNDPQTMTGGKAKQEVVIGDQSGKASLTVWEPNIGILKPNKSYQLYRLHIRQYNGKNHLSLPSLPSIDEVEDVESSINAYSSDEEAIQHEIKNVTISGVRQLETVYNCFNCNKQVHEVNAQIGECHACHTTQKLSNPQQTAKLMFNTENNKKLTLKANDTLLKQITETDHEVTAHDLLYAKAFDCTYNNFNHVTKISRD